MSQNDAAACRPGALAESAESELDTGRPGQVLVDLGWVDLDFYVPPSGPAAQPLLPNSHQPNQSWADSGTLEIQVNKTQSQLTWNTL